MTGKVTVRMVAEAAQVSLATVSRVLNNVPSISDETCENVRKAVLKLRYCVRTGVNRTQIAFLMCPFCQRGLSASSIPCSPSERTV